MSFLPVTKLDYEKAILMTDFIAKTRDALEQNNSVKFTPLINGYKIDFTIEEKYDGKKVLEFLKNQAKASSRLITKLKHDPEGIMLNGVHTRTVDLMKKGDILSITLPVDTEEQISAVEPLPYPLKVFYEDEDLLIVDKPAGLPLHPSHNHQGAKILLGY